MTDGNPVLGSLFVYAPNEWAPAVFAGLYGVSAIVHIYQCWHYKCWKLVGLHPVCAVLFTAGYALREYGAFNYYYSTTNLIVFILSQVFVYICPPLLELANYHVLGRLFFYVPYCAPLPPQRVFSLFGGLMMIVELVNALGVAFNSNPSSTARKQEMGSALTKAALAIQLAVIASFGIIAGLFHWRCNKTKIRATSVMTPLIMLYISMFLILVRCIYRLVEHVGNTSININNLEEMRSLSPILRYEWYFYVFEATLMFINSALWNVWHAGRYLPADNRVYIAKDGCTELQREGQNSDDRPLLAKTGSIFTFGLLFAKKEPHLVLEELNEDPNSTG